MKKLIIIITCLVSSFTYSQVAKEDFEELSSKNGFPLESISLVSLVHVTYFDCKTNKYEVTDIRFLSENRLLEINDNGIIINLTKVEYRSGDSFKVSECPNLDTYFIPFESISYFGIKNDYTKPELVITLKK
jgi:hypothetical protein